MNQEEADTHHIMLESGDAYRPPFNLEDLVRASVHEELEELVEEELMSLEEADSYQEEMVRMRLSADLLEEELLPPGLPQVLPPIPSPSSPASSQPYGSLPEEQLAATKQELPTVLVDLQSHD